MKYSATLSELRNFLASGLGPAEMAGHLHCRVQVGSGGVLCAGDLGSHGGRIQT